MAVTNHGGSPAFFKTLRCDNFLSGTVQLVNGDHTGARKPTGSFACAAGASTIRRPRFYLGLDLLPRVMTSRMSPTTGRVSATNWGAAFFFRSAGDTRAFALQVAGVGADDAARVIGTLNSGPRKLLQQPAGYLSDRSERRLSLRHRHNHEVRRCEEIRGCPTELFAENGR